MIEGNKPSKKDSLANDIIFNKRVMEKTISL